jgi:4a-hydroxytetrahydrobiopterin dehydratase
MNELAHLHCEQVSAGTSRLNDLEVDRLLKDLNGWKMNQIEGEKRLEKIFIFKNFSQAAAFSNQVARISDEEDHHPSILIEWGKVTVNWWTHAIKGLHQNDFIMAAKTDQLYGKELES